LPKGYIDIDEVVNQFEMLSGYHDLHSILHRLISILQDLKCVISHYGVIEKRDAIVNLYHFISEAGRTCPVYSLLQTRSRKLSQDLQKLYDKEHTMKPFYTRKNYDMISGVPQKMIPYESRKPLRMNLDLPVVNQPFYNSLYLPKTRKHLNIQPFTTLRNEPHFLHSKKWKENKYETREKDYENSSSNCDTQLNRFIYSIDSLKDKIIKPKRKKRPLLKTEKGYQNFILNPTGFRLNDYNLNTHHKSFKPTEDQQSLYQVFDHSLNTNKNKDTENKQFTSTTHYVIHNGEPARKAYPKWEDDLRVSRFENFSYSFSNFKMSSA
jgi:hypothetical protein